VNSADFTIYVFVIVKGNQVTTAVWDIIDWKRIGHKRLLGKPISTLSVSLDVKYLAL
jgi:prolactin regulatory element-binding protein